MAKDTEVTAFEPSFSAAQAARETAPEASFESFLTVERLRATSSNFEQLLSDQPILSPKSAKELAETYSVSDKTIQTWVKTVRDAYTWLDVVELQVGASNKLRYTPLCQELLAAYRDSGMSATQWIASVQGENAARLHPEPEILEAEIESTASGSLTTHVESRQATPIIQFNFQNLNVNLVQRHD